MFRLIVTNDEEVVRFARERGAGIFTATQCPEFKGPTGTIKTSGKCMKAHELLRALNINPNIKGYHYLKFIMEKCEENPDYHKRSCTKEIYPECAAKLATTWGRVERAMRHALVLSYSQVPEKYSDIFGGKFTKAPTNSEFIGLISEYFVNNN